MNYNDISPAFITSLKMQLAQKIWEKYSSYKNVKLFLVSSVIEGGWNEPDSFQVFYQDDEQQRVDVEKTILHMPAYETIKMAIDLGIDTPGFLPIVPKFKNVLKDENQTAFQNFERAVKNVYENPDQAVALAASTLEGIIKTILSDEAFSEVATKNLSLTKLTNSIVRAFGFDDNTKCPKELITIAGQLRGLGKAIDDLRSDKSSAHGKNHNDYVVDDPLWASFTVNTSASLGLFLWEYYENKYKPAVEKDAEDGPVPLEDIPF